MGMIGNALKRGLGLDGGKKEGTGKKIAKKAVKKVLTPIIVFLVLGTIIGSWKQLLAESVKSYISDKATEIKDFVTGNSSGGHYVPGGVSSPTGSATVTASPTPSAGATGVAVTSQPTLTGVEEYVMLGGVFSMTDNEARDMMLENVSIEDLVKGTINPFGYTGDGDERFKDITIKTERKLHVRKHPSGEGEAAYRAQKRSEMWAEKEAAYNAAVSAAAQPTPTASTTPTGTPAPTGSPTPPPVPTPPQAPTPPPAPSAPTTASSSYRNYHTATPTEIPKEETYARPKYDTGFADENGNLADPTSTPRTTTAPRVTATPRATTVPSPTTTGGATTSPLPSVSPSGTGTATPSVTGTGTPTPTVPPIPTPTWTEADEQALNSAVDAWVAANTYEDDITDYITTTISGEQLRRYMNSFHTPWQINYNMAAYIELYELDGSDSSSHVSISENAANMAFGFGNNINYGLKVDYWDGTWEDKEIKYEDKESVLGDCFIDGTADYTDEPLELDDETDLLKEESFVPIVLFTSIDGWAVSNTYGERLETINAYGYYNQAISYTDVSSVMDGFFSYVDIDIVEVELFLLGIESMPEPERFLSQLMAVTSLFDPSKYAGCYIDISAYTHLDAGTQGGRAVLMAYDVVRSNAIYSQELRGCDGYYDCSSLVCRIYSDLGIDLSWGGNTDTDALAHYFVDHSLVVCRGWNESVLQPGDVILWSKPARTDHYLCVYHAGIYAGDGMIVDASSSRGHVVYRQMWGIEQVCLVGRPSAGMGGIDVLDTVENITDVEVDE